MYGYEKLPSTPLPGKKPQEIDQNLFNLIHNIKNKLVEEGLTEVQTYSYFSTDILKNLGWMDHFDKLIKVSNPISSETEYLRQNIWSNLLEVAANNLKRGFKDIAIFEIGKIYSPGKDDNPEENYSLSIALMNNTDNPIQELYNIFGGLRLHLEGVKLKLNEDKKDEERNFHPKRFAFLEKNNQVIGTVAEVHPRVVNKFGVEQRAAIFEINLTALL